MPAVLGEFAQDVEACSSSIAPPDRRSGLLYSRL